MSKDNKTELTPMEKSIEAIKAQVAKLIEAASAIKNDEAAELTDEQKEAFKSLDVQIRGARTLFGVSGYQRKEPQPSPEGFVSMEEFAELLGVKLVTLRARWPLYRVEEHKFEGRRGLFFKEDEAKEAAAEAQAKRDAKAAAKAAKEAAEAAAKETATPAEGN